MLILLTLLDKLATLLNLLKNIQLLKISPGLEPRCARATLRLCFYPYFRCTINLFGIGVQCYSYCSLIYSRNVYLGWFDGLIGIFSYSKWCTTVRVILSIRILHMRHCSLIIYMNSIYMYCTYLMRFICVDISKRFKNLFYLLISFYSNVLLTLLNHKLQIAFSAVLMYAVKRE